MPLVFRWERRVEFCETDAAGIVHFSQLIVYMEQAEHAMLRYLGLSVAPHATSQAKSFSGTSMRWPRVAVECQFHSPARFEDVLCIEVSIAKIGNASVKFAHSVSLEDRLVATGSMTCVCCVESNGTLEACAIPQSYLALLRPFAV